MVTAVWILLAAPQLSFLGGAFTSKTRHARVWRRLLDAARWGYSLLWALLFSPGSGC